MNLEKHIPQSCPNCSLELYALEQTLPKGAFSFCPRCQFPLPLIAEKYQLRKLLGEGGFGKVYLAHHVHFEEENQRAIKILHSQFLQDESIKKRFQQEIQVTAQLSRKNKHIVQIFDDFGTIPKIGFFYVMEYLDGVPLQNYLQKHSPLSVQTCLHIFRQLCQGVAAAHQHNVIHRDLKPPNLMLVQTPEDRLFLKIMDFGIAKLFNDNSFASETLTKGPIGTPSYMSPEQCLNQPTGPATDIYAMGTILYELLLGSPPFAGLSPQMSPQDLLIAQVHYHPPSLCARATHRQLPPLFDAVILRALAKDPKERYTHALDFLEQVEACLSVRPPVDLWSTQPDEATKHAELALGNTDSFEKIERVQLSKEQPDLLNSSELVEFFYSPEKSAPNEISFEMPIHMLPLSLNHAENPSDDHSKEEIAASPASFEPRPSQSEEDDETEIGSLDAFEQMEYFQLFRGQTLEKERVASQKKKRLFTVVFVCVFLFGCGLSFIFFVYQKPNTKPSTPSPVSQNPSNKEPSKGAKNQQQDNSFPKAQQTTPAPEDAKALEKTTERSLLTPASNKQPSASASGETGTTKHPTLGPKSIVSITSSPHGARVFVNNQFIGHTPLYGVKLKKGKHDLTLFKKNYEAIEQQLHVDQTHHVFSYLLSPQSSSFNRKKSFTNPNQIKSLSSEKQQKKIHPVIPNKVQLQPLPKHEGRVSLRLSTQPQDAKVFLNGKMLGTTPLHITQPPLYQARITIEKAGYLPYSFFWIFRKNARKRISLIEEL